MARPPVVPAGARYRLRLGTKASRAPAPNSQARVGVTKYAYAWSELVHTTEAMSEATTTRVSSAAATGRHGARPAPCAPCRERAARRARPDVTSSAAPMSSGQTR